MDLTSVNIRIYYHGNNLARRARVLYPPSRSSLRQDLRRRILCDYVFQASGASKFYGYQYSLCRYQ